MRFINTEKENNYQDEILLFYLFLKKNNILMNYIFING